MKARVRTAISTMLREARPFASVLVTLAVYGCLRTSFVLLTGSVGLLAPSGSVHLGVAGLGLVVLGLRLWVVFVVPVLFVYKLARRLEVRPWPGWLSLAARGTIRREK